MESKFPHVKITLYVFLIIMVGILFAVRVYNAWQRTNYVTETIFENGDVQVTLSYPAKILSAKNDVSYPLILAFSYTGDTTSPHTYEFFLQSPTLLFVDAKGAEITPRFQFVSDHIFLEQGVYVRPYLSESYPDRHIIDIHALVDGHEAHTQRAPIEIHAEPMWLSFFSLAAASLVEISVVTALITWIVNAIDAAWAARRERVAKIREELSRLSSLSYLEQVDRIHKIEEEVRKENLDDIDVEIKGIKGQFTEEEFFRTLGQQVRQDRPIDFPKIQTLCNFLGYSDRHKECLTSLGEILGQEPIPQKDALLLISRITELWGDFDIDAKDLILGALKQLLQKVDVSSIPASELLMQVFNNHNRRRLLRDTEIRALFPQSSFLPPVGYNAAWLRLPDFAVNPLIVSWLKQHDLVSNPFGSNDFRNFPFYPERFAYPETWTDFLSPLPHCAQCPAPEDAKMLAFHLRSECLPVKKVNTQGNETVEPGRQAFPVLISFEQTTPVEMPLITLARSAARAWMEILPFSPDAMLDLGLAEQGALLELLCWAFGSNQTVINLLKRHNPNDDSTSFRFLTKRVGKFKSEIASAHLPQDAILISWLKVKPPDLNFTYLLLLLDELPVAARASWLEQFSLLISTLFLNGIVTKAFSSSPIPANLHLSVVQLNWSEDRLKTSLASQFEAAMDKTKQKEMGQIVDFRSLFGSDPNVGYFETEASTTDKLISASRNSLARMLALGNRLLQYHCEHRQKDGVPEKYLHVADLDAILNAA